MTRLLLHFPWDLAAVFTPAGQTALKCLHDFENLLRSTSLDTVPFIEDYEQAALWRPEHDQRLRRNDWRGVAEFLGHCRSQPGNVCLATPDQPPPDLRDSWRRALREELDNERRANGWRSPQIIVPKSHSSDWRGRDEIDIRCEQCGDKPPWDPEPRVLAVLEEYASHRFATSDLDPWDLQRTNPPNPDRSRQRPPCCLPKPPSLQRVPLECLYEKLQEACRIGCRIDGRHYFIPPEDWRPERVERDHWRKGRAFPYELSQDRNQEGYRDYEGLIWIWDRDHGERKGERHWDIQKGGKKYESVSHTGKVLKLHR